MKTQFRKQVSAAILILLLCVSLLPLTGVEAKGETRKFKDDAGRVVEIPEKIKSIAPSGMLAQTILITAVPEKLCGIARKPADEQLEFLPENLGELPEFGVFYGKNANFNLEAVLKANPDIIIDIGEKKKKIAEDMDQLQKQIGIPTVFIEANLDGMDQCYARLEELLGKSEQLSKLQEDVRETLERSKKTREKLEKDKKDIVKVYLAMGEDGSCTDAKESFHAQVLPLIPLENVADVEPQPKSGVTQVSMEQILLWEPDWILVDNVRLLEDMKKDKTWEEVPAFKAGRVMLVPNMPYGFLNNPPSINRLLGLDYFGATFYPELYPFKPEERVKEFYQLYYGTELEDEQLDKILHPSLDEKADKNEKDKDKKKK